MRRRPRSRSATMEARMSTDDAQEAVEDVQAPSVPRPRSGRHAMRRKPVMQRIQVPVGRALALTAVPTALLMGGMSARMAVAADKGASTSTPDAAATTGSGTSGANCGPTTSGKGSTGPSASASPSSSASPSASPSSAASSAATQNGGTRSGSGTPSAAPSGSASNSTPSTAASPSATPSASSSSSPPSLLDILDPLHLLHSAATPSAASSSASSTSVVGGVSKAVSGVTNSVAGKDSTVGKTVGKATGTVSGAASALGGTVSSAASTASDPGKLAGSLAGAAASAASGSSSTASSSQNCDISKMAAPNDLTAGEFPDVTWNLKSSQLKLYNATFHGVVTVQTAAGPKRVLKFTADAVDIGDLKMNAYEGADGNETLHIDGGPGSTSTMRTTGGQQITMYVTQLTGTIAGLEGIPLPPLLRVTLTPDTIPAWLYNLIGDLNLKLQLTLDNADIDQVGQTGGNLTIPGFHGYGVPGKP
jgi:hypothetical protein